MVQRSSVQTTTVLGLVPSMLTPEYPKVTVPGRHLLGVMSVQAPLAMSSRWTAPVMTLLGPSPLTPVPPP